MIIYSSGGVGDALIVGMKIEHMRLWTKANISGWVHREKHECHAKPCQDIISHFVPGGKFVLSDNPERDAKQDEWNDKDGSQYINTKIRDFPHPYLPNPIENNYHLKSELWDAKDYICVQTTAGRLHDNTRRSISFKVIHSLKEKFPDKTIVLLGPETLDIEESGTVNLTGKTKSILDAFSIINNCGLFVGQDGVLSYYAAMLGKLTMINYHIPNLLNHYWNGHWKLHTMQIVGAGNKLDHVPEGCALDNFFKMVK